jgi:hypothetical protein
VTGRRLLKREREEREQVRRDEAAAFDARSELRREEARLLREDEARRETASRTERAEEKAESRRRFEESLEMDRAEARQRHEQMMLLISALVPKK